ncbi:MAG TPA: hypothetical protein DCY40_01975, partial [Actinobacteria bacterium]|nr:hypothetical protein [Actinomycetota bacterium]
LVADGAVEAVAAELERPHEVRGIAARRGAGLVVEALPGMAVPPPGVYAGLVGRDALEAVPAAIRIDGGVGVRVLDADPGFDGSPLRVRFVARMGDEATESAIRLALARQGS